MRNCVLVILVFCGLSASALAQQAAPTVEDLNAALSEANTQAGLMATRSQNYAATLARANAEIAKLKDELDKAKSPPKAEGVK